MNCFRPSLIERKLFECIGDTAYYGTVTVSEARKNIQESDVAAGCLFYLIWSVRTGRTMVNAYRICHLSDTELAGVDVGWIAWPWRRSWWQRQQPFQTGPTDATHG